MKLVLMTACIVLAACSEPQQADSRHSGAETDDRETVFDPLTEQLDRAEAVEDTVEQHKRDIDAALEEAEDRDE